MTEPKQPTRRSFLQTSGIALGALALPRVGRAAPAVITPDASRPLLAQGIQIGDVLGERAIVWSRADRPARQWVEWDLSPRFTNPRRVRGPHALESGDFVTRVDLTDLPRDREIFVRVTYESLDGGSAMSAPALGRFQSAPLFKRGVRFVWGGDTAGQGYGINPDFGGMKIYETMRKARPDSSCTAATRSTRTGPSPPS